MRRRAATSGKTTRKGLRKRAEASSCGEDGASPCSLCRRTAKTTNRIPLSSKRRPQRCSKLIGLLLTRRAGAGVRRRRWGKPYASARQVRDAERRDRLCMTGLFDTQAMVGEHRRLLSTLCCTGRLPRRLEILSTACGGQNRRCMSRRARERGQTLVSAQLAGGAPTHTACRCSRMMSGSVPYPSIARR